MLPKLFVCRFVTARYTDCNSCDAVFDQTQHILLRQGQGCRVRPRVCLAVVLGCGHAVLVAVGVPCATFPRKERPVVAVRKDSVDIGLDPAPVEGVVFISEGFALLHEGTAVDVFGVSFHGSLRLVSYTVYNRVVALWVVC